MSSNFKDTIDTAMLDSAAKRVEEKMMRRLDPNELNVYSQDLLQAITDERSFAEQKKTAMAQLNAQQKVLKDRTMELHQVLSSGTIEEEGTFYYFPDFSTYTMHVYNAKGVRVKQRPMRSNETQMDLHSMALNASQQRDEEDEENDEKFEDQ